MINKITYIIAGKLDGYSFIMSDCISKNIVTNKKTFVDKIEKLKSSKETYFSLTGSPFILNCVIAYDYWLSLNNNKNDFVAGNKSMIQLQSVVMIMIETFPEKNEMHLGENRFFFIDKNDVVYYDLNFNNQNKFERSPEKSNLESNYLIDSVINFTPEPINLDSKAIVDYCKNHLKMISKSYGVNFKDRFTFIQLFKNGKSITSRPYKRFSDIIAHFNGIDYDKIDNEDFKWEI